MWGEETISRNYTDIYIIVMMISAIMGKYKVLQVCKSRKSDIVGIANPGKSSVRRRI